MSTTTANTTGTVNAATIGAHRIGYELRSYFRAPDAVFFTFLFPIVMLALFSVAFSSAPDIQAGPNVSVDYATYYLPGLVATGILLSGTQSLGVDIAGERSDGTLKRLGGTPLPVLSYFIGKIGMVLVTTIVQTALLLAIASLVFGVDLPTDGGAWARFAGVMFLGVATSCVLGIAISALPREGRRATATIVPIVLVLQFISGVYLPFTQLPDWLQNVASVFPLRWMASGMRSVFLPDAFASAEPGGAWHLGLGIFVLAAWLVVGAVACLLTFRWNRKDA
ncbi:ABC-2 type transport system permease protein [Curtobacterium flaccumfaciens]|uniref:Transport permease protein n=1 Tax=Curtobacterium flaccumfaciens TaxID=2035 RepID=A0A4R6DFB8_9MICO|nr:ABC transporter permease [Curtobacterium flaccumfaciens]TDN43345.1 ABC-2 type transport system permease protein [Curtobacterium flaccumfaciens]